MENEIYEMIGKYISILLDDADIKMTPLMLRRGDIGGIEAVCEIKVALQGETDWKGFGVLTIPVMDNLVIGINKADLPFSVDK